MSHYSHIGSCCPCLPLCVSWSPSYNQRSRGVSRWLCAGCLMEKSSCSEEEKEGNIKVCQQTADFNPTHSSIQADLWVVLTVFCSTRPQIALKISCRAHQLLSAQDIYIQTWFQFISGDKLIIWVKSQKQLPLKWQVLHSCRIWRRSKPRSQQQEKKKGQSSSYHSKTTLKKPKAIYPFQLSNSKTQNRPNIIQWDLPSRI